MSEMGFLLLEGGAEFGGAMAEPDRQGLGLAGGMTAPVVILPTAAAPDRNDERAGSNAVRWFRSLGASRADVVRVVDRASADDATLASRIRGSRLIYLLGGFPRYLAETLHNSRAWEAAAEAYASGAVLAGSSAGAMVLCSVYFDAVAGEVLPGLGLLENCCILPHHNTFGKGWAAKLLKLLPGVTLLGIDEQTGALHRESGHWSTHGAGQVTIYREGETEVIDSGKTFSFDPDG